jgi:hypothetical protein
MASLITLLKPIINELLIKEIGEANIVPLKWDKKLGTDTFVFYIEIEDKEVRVKVSFDEIEDEIYKQYYFPPKYRDLDNVWNLAYEVGNTDIQYTKTNLKTILTILSTVVDITKSFIKNQSPNGLFIKGTSKELGSDNISQKSNLYRAFISKQLSDIPNYNVDTYKEGFIIIKNA